MEFLKQFPIFQEMTDDEFERLTRIAMKRSYEPKAFVFMEGEEREAVFFIQSRLVKAYKIDEAGNG
ncbi:hypothetical protein P4637_00050 [Halalkalibacterium halodurans]|uniref:BH0235 protein n=1 Tax=Halalkalibacterium halodurans (strain ATCC BAA-125 / DSM 18197 / FERM 7344 / JCM 9153 / C-125) TaxID=272558 RepID=Q9KG77_HALH5|nr:hypothetical protein [Halalkalibacterium halodurans]MED3646994.1 hypothetical protein [Halalkalibacterium halodurans]MED4082828.1 hypothetical protein [Halalkalibacterium halodurans]MED4083253.1 hypothetical protein [Halalkalibacterium halodurans]MED4105218.1 hypothetical protein [Halalkalibacterium halodurans]MED4110635.1 hypothetical protein [Halalkalibacterium halodurans]